jgi:hypothetical protein
MASSPTRPTPPSSATSSPAAARRRRSKMQGRLRGRSHRHPSAQSQRLSLWSESLRRRGRGRLAALCKEPPSKTTGASCDSTPSSCPPNHAQEQPHGRFHTEHLACKAGTCQPAALPEHFYTPCSAFTSTGDGFVGSEQCPYCLAYKDIAGGCIRTGRTGPCWSDHACPQGSFCDDSIVNLSQPTAKIPLCRPGPRKGLPQGLTCMIGPRDR